MLDEIQHRQGEPITNLALQKYLYFAHGLHLLETGEPLVTGYFEAWKFGPVHPAAYRAFKSAGDQPIRFRADREDPLTGARSPIYPPNNTGVWNLVNRVLGHYGQLTPGRLVEISHARGAPWEFIVSQARTSMAFGLRIPDDVIRERFRFHKISVGVHPATGEPGEDSPFA